MKRNWKMLRLVLATVALGATVGCGGLNGSYNLSPASFLLPGLGHVAPASTNSTVHTFAAVE